MIRDFLFLSQYVSEFNIFFKHATSKISHMEMKMSSDQGRITSSSMLHEISISFSLTQSSMPLECSELGNPSCKIRLERRRGKSGNEIVIVVIRDLDRIKFQISCTMIIKLSTRHRCWVSCHRLAHISITTSDRQMMMDLVEHKQKKKVAKVV